MTVVAGPGLLANCRRVLGPDPHPYRFLADRVEHHGGRRAFSSRRMREVLGAQPYLLPAMTDAGRRALAAYGGFVTETVALAAADAEVARTAADAEVARTAAG
ncbi:hypothetical protein ABZ714_01490 [Streptomyces sp. NPDC006798]|uniref:hypothetical protein n=1 Tax=Streptomyces sp. NPDC006798 TaxID=3155462 RepID=UPI0033CB3D5D